eukprot:154468-Chlamydomonas_euryale.AAC.2
MHTGYTFTPATPPSPIPVPGRWREAEVELLKTAVKEYMDTRVQEEAAAAAAGAEGAAPPRTGRGRGDGRQTLDDIDWGVIAERVDTRDEFQCRKKWWVGEKRRGKAGSIRDGRVRWCGQGV